LTIFWLRVSLRVFDASWLVQGTTLQRQGFFGGEARGMTKAQQIQKVLEAIKTQTKRAAKSKATARDFLIREGIYTADGALREEFGGSKKKSKAA
jgi:hypothetical protein